MSGVVTLSDLSTDEVLDLVLADQPDVRNGLAEAWSQAWAAADPVLLELCRLRIAMLLGCDAEFASRTAVAVAAGLSDETVAVLAAWPTSDRFGPRERACLGFTEQFVVAVAGMDDAVVEAVREQLGDQGLVDFVSALLVVEQRQRLRLTWERLFEDAS
jgi:alkylhydroperoxidase family enzyme